MTGRGVGGTIPGMPLPSAAPSMDPVALEDLVTGIAARLDTAFRDHEIRFQEVDAQLKQLLSQQKAFRQDFDASVGEVLTLLKQLRR